MMMMVMNLDIRSWVARSSSTGQDCRVSLSHLKSIAIVILSSIVIVILSSIVSFTSIIIVSLSVIVDNTLSYE